MFVIPAQAGIHAFRDFFNFFLFFLAQQADTTMIEYSG
jgi:hypothetical protein